MPDFAEMYAELIADALPGYKALSFQELENLVGQVIAIARKEAALAVCTYCRVEHGAFSVERRVGRFGDLVHYRRTAGVSFEPPGLSGAGWDKCAAAAIYEMEARERKEAKASDQWCEC